MLTRLALSLYQTQIQPGATEALDAVEMGSAVRSPIFLFFFLPLFRCAAYLTYLPN